MHQAGAERYNERTECLGLALRQSGSGFGRTQHRGVEGEEAGQFYHPSGAGRQIASVMVSPVSQTE